MSRPPPSHDLAVCIATAMKRRTAHKRLYVVHLCREALGRGGPPTATDTRAAEAAWSIGRHLRALIVNAGFQP